MPAGPDEGAFAFCFGGVSRQPNFADGCTFKERRPGRTRGQLAHFARPVI
jgi:hypothetical protein